MEAPPIKEAAKGLQTVFKGRKHFITVGVNEKGKKLYLYFSSRQAARRASQEITYWYCYPVEAKFSRKPQPA